MARGPQAGIRLSFEPLESALAHQNIEAEFLDLRFQRAIWKARFNGYFTLAMADEIACDVLAMHPLEVWGQEYEDKAWFDMHDTDEPTTAKVIAFPAPVEVESVEVVAVAA